MIYCLCVLCDVPWVLSESWLSCRSSGCVPSSSAESRLQQRGWSSRDGWRASSFSNSVAELLRAGTLSSACSRSLRIAGLQLSGMSSRGGACLWICKQRLRKSGVQLHCGGLGWPMPHLIEAWLPLSWLALKELWHWHKHHVYTSAELSLHLLIWKKLTSPKLNLFLECRVMLESLHWRKTQAVVQRIRLSRVYIERTREK